MVQYKFKDRFAPVIPNSSVLIGSLVTSYARIRLFEALETAVGLYGPGCLLCEYHFIRKRSVIDMFSDCDTDSLIIKRPRSSSPLPTSTALGALKEEIRSAYGEGAFAETFFSTGAKSYGLAVRKEDGSRAWISRSKGFRATHLYQETMNPEKILSYLLAQLKSRNRGGRRAFEFRSSVSHV